MRKSWLIVVLALGLSACDEVMLPPDEAADKALADAEAQELAAQTVEAKAATGFTTLSDLAWNEAAVRRVLRTFAYGGQASETQIRNWAALPAREAIVQMLSFKTTNLKLSPPTSHDKDGLSEMHGSLRGLRTFWASNYEANNTPAKRRPDFSIGSWNVAQRVWVRATRSRGLNPFRQKIGLWETNYHLAVNNNVGVNYAQVLRYYDEVMDALAGSKPYQQVLSKAAQSAAVAMQYGHRYNRWVNGQCECNEDFAREYHQLFFGILGNYNPSVHERQTIKNTAIVLTDMSVPYNESTGYADRVTFGTRYHRPGSAVLLQQSIDMGPTAVEGLDNLSEIAIAHPESLENLPVKIIAGLADDNLDEEKIRQIRSYWASMPEKKLLKFLQAYATSTTFHNPTRLKYLSTIDRQMLVTTQLTFNNIDAALDLYYPDYALNEEGVQVFAPKRNVFGGQTGFDAISSSEVFKSNYGHSTEGNWLYAVEGDRYGSHFKRDFRYLLSASGTNDFQVSKVAEVLWNRFIGDGLKNFGPLERAHVHALLARGTDIASALSENNPERVLTTADVTRMKTLIDSWGQTKLDLASEHSNRRLEFNRRVMTAIEFVIATPYMYVEEGL